MTESKRHYISDERLEELHAQGLGDQAIADAAGVSARTVGRARDRHVPPLPRNPAPRAPSALLKPIQELHAQGMTDAQMAEELKVHEITVRKLRGRTLKLPVNRALSLPGELKQLWEEGVFRDDKGIARYYNINLEAAKRRRQRAGIKLRTAAPARTTPEKLALALTLLRDEQMSYRAAAQAADLPPRRLAEEFPGYGWTPEQAGALRNLERQLDKQIEHAWPAYADKFAA